MIQRVERWFRDCVSLDLGTTSTRLAVAGRGIVVDEPSVVAIERETGKILGRGHAVGVLARQMLGRTPDSMMAVRPVQSGVVTDFRLAEAMIGYFLRKSGARTRLRPQVAIAVPSGLTPVESRAVMTSAERSGAGRVFLIEHAVAASIGAGLPITEPLASLVCSIGGGTTEIAVLSLGEVIASRSLRVAGDEFDEAISEFVRLNYSMRIGRTTAEQLKRDVGSATPLPDEISAEVRGLDTVSGIPRKAAITSEEVRQALADPLARIINGVRSVIERCDAELVGDLTDTGMLLTGGSAQLRGLPAFLEAQLGIPVRVDLAPTTTVIRGTSLCLDHLPQWRSRFLRSRD